MKCSDAIWSHRGLAGLPDPAVKEIHVSGSHKVNLSSDCDVGFHDMLT